MPKIEPRICGLTRWHARKSDACANAINITLSPELTRRFGRIQGVFSAPTDTKTADAVVAHLEDAFVRGALEAERRRGTSANPEQLFEDSIASMNAAIAKLFGPSGLPLNPKLCSAAIMAVKGQTMIVAAWGGPELLLYRFPEKNRVRIFDLLSDQEPAGEKTGFTSVITGSLQPGDKVICSTRSIRDLIGPEQVERALCDDPSGAINQIRESLTEADGTAAVAIIVADVAEFRFVEEGGASTRDADIRRRDSDSQNVTNDIIAPTIAGETAKAVKAIAMAAGVNIKNLASRAIAEWKQRQETAQKEKELSLTNEPLHEEISCHTNVTTNEGNTLSIETQEFSETVTDDTDDENDDDESSDNSDINDEVAEESLDEEKVEDDSKNDDDQEEDADEEDDEAEEEEEEEEEEETENEPGKTYPALDEYDHILPAAHVIDDDEYQPTALELASDKARLAISDVRDTTSRLKNTITTKEGIQSVGNHVAKHASRAGSAVSVWVKAMSWTKRLTIAGTLIAIGAISALIISDARIKRTSAIEEAQRTAYVEIERRLDMAESSLIYSDNTRAVTLLDEASKLLDEVTGLAGTDMNKTDGYRTRLNENLARMRKEIQLPEPTVIHVSENVITSFNILAGTLWAVTDNGTISSIREASVETVSGVSGLTGRLAALDQGIAAIKSGGMTYIDRSGAASDRDFPAGDATITDIVAYSGRLYALDAERSSILRFMPVAAGWKTPDQYVTDDTDLTDSTSLAIDSSIYVLKRNGEVIKLFKGAKADYGVTTIEPAITNATKLRITDSELFILDSTGGRIVRFDKTTGALGGQLVSDKIKSASDFTLSADAKTLFVSNGNNILTFDLSSVQSNN